MAKTMRWKWNLREFEKIRRSPQVKRDLRRQAEQIAQRAGAGYEVQTGEGQTRSRAAVVTTTRRAMRDNARNNTLLRAAKGGR